MNVFVNHKYFFFVAGILCLVASCKKEVDQKLPQPPAKSGFQITGDNFLPDQNDVVSVPVTFEKLEGVKALSVSKSGADRFSEEISAAALKLNYEYKYHLVSGDPESFKLVFELIYTDGSRSRKTSVTIVNKRGFFIMNLKRIARVTGRTLLNEQLPNPNTTDGNWDVGGTDLGIIWEMESGKYGVFFGDTFGADFRPNPSHPGPNGGNWRSNVLGFSENTNLDEGVIISRMVTGTSTRAVEVIPGKKSGGPTSIPTAAVRANGADYVHYFHTDPILAGVPFYHSGVYKSVDNGMNWSKVETIHFPSDSRFALAGYWKKDGYVYMIGTPAYRDKPGYLARFREADIENQSAYEYWDGAHARWVKGDERAGTILVDGTVGELSFLFNETLNKWILIYGDIGHGFVSLRTADNITGPWSAVHKLVSPDDYPMHYGPYLHPLSATGNVLYFTLSMWEPYNVFLMKATIVDR